MMACSYLSTAGMAAETSGAACWTPPAIGCMTSEMEGPSSMQPPTYHRLPAAPLTIPPTVPLSLPPAAPLMCPGPLQEPALDLSTTSTSLKSRLSSPPSDDEAE